MSMEGYPIVDYLSTNAECELRRGLCYNLHFDYLLSERENTCILEFGVNCVNLILFFFFTLHTALTF